MCQHQGRNTVCTQEYVWCVHMDQLSPLTARKSLVVYI